MVKLHKHSLQLRRDVEPNDCEKDEIETNHHNESFCNNCVRPVILLGRLMSEPFSITSGLLGILGSAYMIAKDTHDFISDIKSAPKRIRSLSDDINIFCSILANLERVFREDGRFSGVPTPKVPGALEPALADSIRIFKELERVISSYVTSSGDNPTPVWRAFVWTWNSKEVKSLTDEMMAQKATLNLALTEAIYESTIRISQMAETSTQNQEHQGTTLEMILRSVERGRQEGQCETKGVDLDFCLRRYFDYAESSTTFSSPRTRPTSPSMVGSSDDGMETQLQDEQSQYPQAYGASKPSQGQPAQPRQNEGSGVMPVHVSYKNSGLSYSRTKPILEGPAVPARLP